MAACSIATLTRTQADRRDVHAGRPARSTIVRDAMGRGDVEGHRIRPE